MTKLNQKALASVLGVLIAMALLLFAPAETIHYWQAWVFLGVYGMCSLAITIYLMKRDPGLLERRLRGGPIAEKKPIQKTIQSITALGFVAMLVVPAVDHRFGGSGLPAVVVLAGDVLVVGGFLMVFFVFRENTFASATVEVAREQRVISTGPYALVRHPMYAGSLVWLIGMSLALGSKWGPLVLLLMLPALIWRLLDEEKLLTDNLPGYWEYCQTVRYRLLPHVW
jgi:protein-S-isoprenylcysteine O-methyltransferase Ste14